METTTVPANTIEMGDAIYLDGEIYRVVFTALLAGVNIELTLKKTGLHNRMTAEKKFVMYKNLPVKKIIY